MKPARKEKQRDRRCANGRLVGDVIREEQEGHTRKRERVELAISST